jgi:pimeloyl-ACP methyl ester carboxylesterase
MEHWRLAERQPTAAGLVAWDRFGSGPPVVFIHGTPWSSFAWRHVAAAMSAAWTVYVYDLPGFGESGKGDGQDVSLAAQSQVFIELLDAWGLARPVAIAHDIGGAIALRATLLHDREFAALALLDPVAISPWGSPFYRLVRDHVDVFTALPPHIHAAVAESYIRSALPEAPTPQVLARLLEPWLAAGGQAALYRQIAQGDERHTDEFRDRLGDVSCPVLVVWGEQDPWIPVARGRELAELLGGSPVRTIAGAGHLVQEDAPGQVLHHLLKFLSAQASIELGLGHVAGRSSDL